MVHCYAIWNDVLMGNHTWSLVEAPLNTPLTDCKWVFKKKKTNPDGLIDRYKARLVTKGYSQTPGFDLSETFSLVVKLTTIQIVLPIAISYGWNLKQVDVNNAILNGTLSENVYMKQHPGFEIIDPNSTLCVNCTRRFMISNRLWSLFGSTLSLSFIHGIWCI